ncbi:hypothetical protein [Saccharopolyspora shandongensis]|uniref:hypothetical protein n=1 Tax=Saccharopolyspora shandongensis TaxID=418495 RepID=UPI0033E5E56B
MGVADLTVDIDTGSVTAGGRTVRNGTLVTIDGKREPNTSSPILRSSHNHPD